MPHDLVTPSSWVLRWACLIPEGGLVLDVACGSGRHARWLAGLGCVVDAVDRDERAIAALRDVPGVCALCADLEGGAWPYQAARYAAVIVTNYLHRPLFDTLVGALAPGGVLIYETFAAGNERFGKPSNPEYLLRPGELLDATRPQLRVVAYEDVFVDAPKPAMVQRVCAVAPAS